MSQRELVLAFFPASQRADPSILALAERLEFFIAADTLLDRLEAWIRLVRWTREGVRRTMLTETFGTNATVAINRLEMLLNVLEQVPDIRQGFHRALGMLLSDTQALDLFGEAGIPGYRGFFPEFAERLMRELLPVPRNARDATAIMHRLYGSMGLITRFSRLPGRVFHRIVEALAPDEHEHLWRPVDAAFADAFRLLAARVQAQGLAQKLRARSHVLPVTESPFFRLVRSSDALLDAWLARRELAPRAAAWRWDCQGCWAEMREIRQRLETEGVSVDIVYGLAMLERCLGRMECMVGIMEAPWGPQRSAAIHEFFTQLMVAVHEDRSLLHLVRSNTMMLQRKIVDRSGQTGEHYIAYTKKDYRHIWAAAAGGGLLTVFTCAMKMTIHELDLPPFPEGFFYGLNYAVSFVLMQTFGLMLATKQPAMTAATLASIMRSNRGPERADEIVDFMVRISHSQVAAAMSNVLVVAAGAVALDFLWRFMTGHPFLELDEAKYLYKTFSPVNSGTVIFAAFTGVLLYLSSLVGGWLDNWAVYHRLPQGIAHSRLSRYLGSQRMQRVASAIGRNTGGWGTNVSLGFMLGMAPDIGRFLGIPIDVRHVTLSTGILALATAALGKNWFHEGWFLYALLGIATMFVLNLGVSFALSLYTAIRAYELPGSEVRDILKRLAKRLLRHPGDFILPPRTDSGIQGHSHE